MRAGGCRRQDHFRHRGSPDFLRVGWMRIEIRIHPGSSVTTAIYLTKVHISKYISNNVSENVMKWYKNACMKMCRSLPSESEGCKVGLESPSILKRESVILEQTKTVLT